jgi:hypothetical protein
VTKAERYLLLKSLAPKLVAIESGELELILRQFEVEWAYFEYEIPPAEYVMARLERSSDDILLELSSFLDSGAIDSIVTYIGKPGPWKSGRFKLFLSHRAEDKVVLAELKRKLEKYGIDCFLAHEDISPTEEWVNVIESALRSCDSLATWLTPNFHASDWVDHEIGIAYSRHVLLVPLKNGVDPYGFFGKYQGMQCVGLEIEEVAKQLFLILIVNELTQDKCAAGLVQALHDTEHFSDAKELAGLLRHVASWNPELLRSLEACMENPQVNEAWGVPERIQSLVESHSSGIPKN